MKGSVIILVVIVLSALFFSFLAGFQPVESIEENGEYRAYTNYETGKKVLIDLTTGQRTTASIGTPLEEMHRKLERENVFLR